MYFTLLPIFSGTRFAGLERPRLWWRTTCLQGERRLKNLQKAGDAQVQRTVFVPSPGWRRGLVKFRSQLDLCVAVQVSVRCAVMAAWSRGSSSLVWWAARGARCGSTRRVLLARTLEGGGRGAHVFGTCSSGSETFAKLLPQEHWLLRALSCSGQKRQKDLPGLEKLLAHRLERPFLGGAGRRTEARTSFGRLRRPAGGGRWRADALLSQTVVLPFDFLTLKRRP